jgi:cob(I)alamin adenosyltransferase
MKIYTKTGDLGETGLFGGPRVSKDDARIEAYGTVDELNAVLGVVRAARPTRAIDDALAQIQSDLFDVGAELATPDPVAHGVPTVSAPEIERLEREIDRLEATLRPLTAFILPAGCSAAAALHLARCVCRRAERRVVTLAGQASVSGGVIIYLNRLSDLLFVMARAENQAAGLPDVLWSGGRNAGG